MLTLASTSFTGEVTLQYSRGREPSVTAGITDWFTRREEVLPALPCRWASGHILCLWMAGHWLPF